jgi:hypothetical protein
MQAMLIAQRFRMLAKNWAIVAVVAACGSSGYADQREIASNLDHRQILPLSAWVGEWKYFDNTIRIKIQGGRLIATGEAYYPSLNPPEDRWPLGPQMGDFEINAKPHNNILSGGRDCKVKLTLAGAYLLASDDDKCGGNPNVTFHGQYSRGKN